MSDRTAMNGDNDCQGKVMEKKENTDRKKQYRKIDTQRRMK